MAENAIDQLKKDSYQYESMLVGFFWCDPFLYEVEKEKISSDDFLNDVWKFFFALGQQLHKKGYTEFTDVAVEQYVRELGGGVKKLYDDFNGYRTMEVLMEECDNQKDNYSSYFDEVKKHASLKKLYYLFGEKVINDPTNEKYNYKLMTREQVITYWTDKVNQLGLDQSGNTYEEHFLLSGIRERLRKMDEEPNTGLPFFKSKQMTNICNGWAYGCLYINGGFGGSGKTSETFNKIIMSCIEHKEKLLVIANEQSIDDFTQMLIINAMSAGNNDFINRQRLNEGNFTEEEREKFERAIQWLEQITEGDEKLIAFVFMNEYKMDDVKKIVTHYANRGYKRVLIDTGKPGDDISNSGNRWERFADDFKALYKLARPNGGGLNLAVWVNVQLADTALGQRFLNEYALAESKKIKNEADVLFLNRVMWQDEYEGGDNELKVYKWVKHGEPAFTDWESKIYTIVEDDGLFGNDSDKPYRKVAFTIKPGEHIHYLKFTAKNRRGKDNKTGQDVLVQRVDFNSNRWIEVGWTKVHDNRNYG